MAPRRKKNLKLPNGFGSITYIGDGRRKPWRVRKTLSWQMIDKETGKEILKKDKLHLSDFTNIVEKQQYINIGTFETYEEAFLALSRFNEKPYAVEDKKLTLQYVIDQWTEAVLPTYAEATRQRHLYNLSRLPDTLLETQISKLKVYDLEHALSQTGSAESVLMQTKSVLKSVFKFAQKHEYCDKNYAEFIDVKSLGGKVIRKNPHTILTEEDISVVRSAEADYKDPIFVALYTGMRPKEVVTLQKKHIHLKDGYICHGMKTEAGKDRIIPIHPEILPIITARYNKSSTGHLFETILGKTRPLTYYTYKFRFNTLLPDHNPHDTRHTFITQWRSVLKLDDNICHVIVGHKSRDVSESVYTHHDLSLLKSEMNRFRYGTGKLSLFISA